MQDRTARYGGSTRLTPVVGVILVGFLAGSMLLGCSSTADSPVTIFADPGQYQYFNCEQLAGQRKYWTGREQEIKQLMDKADQNAGGAIVNVLAYKADHVAATEQVKLIEAAARSKNCETPATWRSNSVIR
jgi:hypothetical protein